jgi:hypothetical protein
MLFPRSSTSDARAGAASTSVGVSTFAGTASNDQNPKAPSLLSGILASYGLRNSAGRLAMLAAIRRASSRVSSLTPLSVQQMVRPEKERSPRGGSPGRGEIAPGWRCNSQFGPTSAQALSWFRLALRDARPSCALVGLDHAWKTTGCDECLSFLLVAAAPLHALCRLSH